MRSVFFNVFQNLIVVLYVFDNDTNMVIRMSTVVGLGIEIMGLFLTDPPVNLIGTKCN